MFLEAIKYTVFLLIFLFVGAFSFVCAFLHRVHIRHRHLPGPKRNRWHTLACFTTTAPPWKDIWPHVEKENHFFSGNVSIFRAAIEKGSTVVQAVLELHEKFGPVLVVYFYHLAYVYVTDPVTIKELLTNDIHKKIKIYDNLFDVYGVRFLGRGMLTERDQARWHTRRAFFNPYFYRKNLIRLMDDFNKSADKLVLLLDRAADTGRSVPLSDGLCKTTLDVIAKAGFGMTEELILEENPFKEAIDIALGGLHCKMRRPYDWIYPSHWKFRGQVQCAIRYIRDIGREVINKQRDGKSDDWKEEGLLGNMMNYYDMNNQEIDMESLIDEFVTFFIAGQETTNSLIAFAIVQMGKHPQVMKRVQDEVDTIVSDKSFIEYQDVMKMEYTLLVLKETLRLYPPMIGTAREPAHDLTSCGHFIPAGSTVQLLHYTISRMKQFHKNPLTFDPERFSRSDKESPQYAYFPFSMGPRSCIGQQFALIEARLIIAKLLQKFNLKLDPAQNFDTLDQLTLKPKGSCMNFIQRRCK